MTWPVIQIPNDFSLYLIFMIKQSPDILQCNLCRTNSTAAQWTFNFFLSLVIMSQFWRLMASAVTFINILQLRTWTPHRKTVSTGKWESKNLIIRLYLTIILFYDGGVISSHPDHERKQLSVQKHLKIGINSLLNRFICRKSYFLEIVLHPKRRWPSFSPQIWHISFIWAYIPTFFYLDLW